MNILEFVIATSLTLVAFWVSIDALPSAIAEWRMDRKLKKAAALAEESKRRYWEVRDNEETVNIRVVKLPHKKLHRTGTHRRVKV